MTRRGRRHECTTQDRGPAPGGGGAHHAGRRPRRGGRPRAGGVRRDEVRGHLLRVADRDGHGGAADRPRRGCGCRGGRHHGRGPEQVAEQAQDAADTVGLVSGIVLLVILFVAYYCGGYVAGRMARFDGLKQGLGVWLWALVAAVVVAVLAAVAGAQYDVLSELNTFPRIPVGAGDLTTGGVIALVARRRGRPRGRAARRSRGDALPPQGRPGRAGRLTRGAGPARVGDGDRGRGGHLSSPRSGSARGRQQGRAGAGRSGPHGRRAARRAGRPSPGGRPRRGPPAGPSPRSAQKGDGSELRVPDVGRRRPR